MDERVLGYVDVLGTGFRPPRYTLVVTDRRVILAQRTKAVEAAAGAGAGGGGGLGRLLGRRPAGPPLGQRYLAMRPDAVLAETPGNVSLAPGGVQRVELVAGETPNDDGPPTRHVLVRMVGPAGDWQLFSTGEAPPIAMVRELLRPVFGPILLG